MYRKIFIAAATIVLFLLAQSAIVTGHEHGHGHGHGHGSHTKKEKKGILLVTFGSSYPEAQKAFKNIEKEVKQAYSDTHIRWAYTSSMIREKLASKDKELLSPAEALARMKDQGFTHVAVQSLHVIKGSEYQDLESVVDGFRSMYDENWHIVLGSPLLSDPESLPKVRDCMLENIPEARKKDEAVIFMGHGTYHPSNAFYQAMFYQFQKKDNLTYIGTIGGSPGIDRILSELAKKDVDKVFLMPFMSVAGDHAKNDMAGDGEDSWKSVLQEEGYKVEVILKGMGEYDNIANIWVENLKDVMGHFK